MVRLKWGVERSFRLYAKKSDKRSEEGGRDSKEVLEVISRNSEIREKGGWVRVMVGVMSMNDIIDISIGFGLCWCW